MSGGRIGGLSFSKLTYFFCVSLLLIAHAYYVQGCNFNRPLNRAFSCVVENRLKIAPDLDGCC